MHMHLIAQVHGVECNIWRKNMRHRRAHQLPDLRLKHVRVKIRTRVRRLSSNVKTLKTCVCIPCVYAERHAP